MCVELIFFKSIFKFMFCLTFYHLPYETEALICFLRIIAIATILMPRLLAFLTSKGIGKNNEIDPIIGL